MELVHGSQFHHQDLIKAVNVDNCFTSITTIHVQVDLENIWILRYDGIDMIVLIESLKLDDDVLHFRVASFSCLPCIEWL